MFSFEANRASAHFKIPSRSTSSPRLDLGGDSAFAVLCKSHIVVLCISQFHILLPISVAVTASILSLSVNVAAITPGYVVIINLDLFRTIQGICS